MKLLELPSLAPVEKMKERKRRKTVIKHRVSWTEHTLDHKFGTAPEKYKKSNEMDSL